MFKLLLLKNCINNNILSKINNNGSKYKINLLNWIKDIKSGIRNVGEQKSSTKLLYKSVFVGGSIGFVTIRNSRNLFVFCDTADRLSGFHSKALEEHELKFDWKKFWIYLKPHLLKLIGAILAALAVAYYNIKIPELLGIFINSLSKYAKIGEKIFNSSEFLNDMKIPAINLFGMYILQSCFTFVYILLLSQIGEGIAAKIRQDLFKQIIIQDLAFFDENRTGELINRLTADVQDFKSSFKQCVSQGLRSIAQLIGGSISLFLISPTMASIALVSVPVAVMVMSLLGGSLRNLSKLSQAQTEKATSVCEEALSNIRTVRSSACEYMEIEMFCRETNLAAKLAQQLGIGIAVFQALTNLFLNGMVLCTLFVGGHMMACDNLSPGQLMAFLVASQGVQRSLAQGSILLGTLIRGMTAGTRVFEYLSIEPKIDLIDGLRIPQNELHGSIVFNNVSFAYPSRPDQIVLKNFNLTLKPGQTIALVGSSGSGKSTVAGLLERFYEPTTGTITIDGYDLKDLSPYWLRSEVIAMIEQQPILFGTSILENIRYGRPNGSVDEIHMVAKLSQAHDFITKLNDSYSTNVGERGVQLSGGQRQRIAIARALLKQPIVLILDEATSALDASSEAVVQEALDTAVLNRTTLVIAHRLSTIKNANLIVVLDQGNIREIGTHTQLMKLKGIYFNLVKQQEKSDKEEDIDIQKSQRSKG